MLVASLLLVLIRCAVMAFGFDFDTSFYTSDTVAYVIYALFIVGLIAPFVACRNAESKAYSSSRLTLFKEIVFGLLAAIFLTFFVLYVVKIITAPTEGYTILKKISHAVCLIFSFVACVYYVLRLFTSKKQGTVLALLSCAPSIFLSSMLIEKFAAIAASAASLSHFPDIISLLLLAFFMLNEGKSFIPEYTVKASKKLSLILCTTVALSFSALPDIFSVIALTNTLSAEAIAFLILKMICLVYSISEALYYVKSTKETEK